MQVFDHILKLLHLDTDFLCAFIMNYDEGETENHSQLGYHLVKSSHCTHRYQLPYVYINHPAPRNSDADIVSVISMCIFQRSTALQNYHTSPRIRSRQSKYLPDLWLWFIIYTNRYDQWIKADAFILLLNDELVNIQRYQSNLYIYSILMYGNEHVTITSLRTLL